MDFEEVRANVGYFYQEVENVTKADRLAAELVNVTLASLYDGWVGRGFLVILREFRPSESKEASKEKEICAWPRAEASWIKNFVHPWILYQVGLILRPLVMVIYGLVYNFAKESFVWMVVFLVFGQATLWLFGPFESIWLLWVIISVAVAAAVLGPSSAGVRRELDSRTVYLLVQRMHEEEFPQNAMQVALLKQQLNHYRTRHLSRPNSLGSAAAIMLGAAVALAVAVGGNLLSPDAAATISAIQESGFIGTAIALITVSIGLRIVANSYRLSTQRAYMLVDAALASRESALEDSQPSGL